MKTPARSRNIHESQHSPKNWNPQDRVMTDWDDLRGNVPCYGTIKGLLRVQTMELSLIQPTCFFGLSPLVQPTWNE